MRYLLTIGFSLMKPPHQTTSRNEACKMISVINCFSWLYAHTLRSHLHGENLSRIRVGSLAYPSYPGKASQLFIHFLTKRGEPFTLWYGYPPSPANFSSYKHFGSHSRGNSVKARQSKHALALLARTKGWLNSTRLGGWPFNPGPEII